VRAVGGRGAVGTGVREREGVGGGRYWTFFVVLWGLDGGGLHFVAFRCIALCVCMCVLVDTGVWGWEMHCLMDRSGWEVVDMDMDMH
jgi:hypothetical protein